MAVIGLILLIIGALVGLLLFEGIIRAGIIQIPGIWPYREGDEPSSRYMATVSTAFLVLVAVGFILMLAG